MSADVMPEQGPAADYGCGLVRSHGRARTVCGNPACLPNPRPCNEFMGCDDGDPEYRYWCPCCGWAKWTHGAVA